MNICDNCGAHLPDEMGGRDHLGRLICCQYGDYGQPETRDWYIPEDGDPVYEDIDWMDGEE